jgi:uncharacterized coiled-coil protein SlyX
MNTKTAGLPELEAVSANSDTAVEVRNSTRTKLAVIVFFLVIVVGAGVAMKTLMFTPTATPATATDTETEPARGANAPAAMFSSDTAPRSMTVAGRQPLIVNDPLDSPPVNAKVADADVHMNQIDDRLDALTDAQSSLRQELTTSSNATQARLSDIESTLAVLSSRIDALRQANDSDAMARFTAQLQQLDQRVLHVERRTKANWQQLHGKAGARRRGASLPFRVSTIDWWDGKPSVAIRTNKGEQFLSVGDTLAGWQLVSADPAAGRAHFTRNGLDATVEAGR